MNLRHWSLAAFFLSLSVGASATPLDWSQLQQQLLTQNPELRASQAKRDAQAAQAKSQWSPFLPELSVAGGYGKEETLHDDDEGYVGYLAGSWNLFRGGQDWQVRKIAVKDSEIANLDHSITERRLIRELGEAYYAALLNSQFVSLDTEKLQFLKNQRAMAQKKINAGLTSNVDAIELDLEESTLSAEIETHKTDLQLALDTIRSLLKSDTAVELNTQSPFPRMSAEDFAAKDLTKNPKLLKQQLLEENASLYRLQNQANYLPRVDLDAQYGRIVPQYEDPINGTESRVSVLMTWTFFSGLETHYKSQAASELENSQKFEKTSTVLQIETELTNLRNKSRELLQLRQLLEKRQTLTQKYYDLTLSEYRRGIKNSSDLASATSSLFDNKTRLLEVHKELAVLKLKFDELTK